MQLFVSALLILPQLVKAAQYCMVDPARYVNACVGISSYANHTTGNSDYYFVISALFHPPLGWAGFGSGGKMENSLMFLMYPGDRYGGKLIFLKSRAFMFPWLEN